MSGPQRPEDSQRREWPDSGSTPSARPDDREQGPSGAPPQGYPDQRRPQPGYPRPARPQPGYPQPDYRHPGYPSQRYPQSPYPQQGQPPPYAQQRQPPPGYRPPPPKQAQPPPYGYPQPGRPQQPQGGQYQQPPAGQPQQPQQPQPQPPQPQPPFGGARPPESQPLLKRRRTRPIVLGVFALLVVAAVLVVGFLTPGYFATKTFDSARMQQDVAKVLQDSYHVTASSVSCPSSEKVKDGTAFSCTATIDGAPHQVPIVVSGNDGRYMVLPPR